jgi:hypothetical protein
MKEKRIRNNERNGRRLERWESPVGHELLEQVNHLGHLAVDENPVPLLLQPTQQAVQHKQFSCHKQMFFSFVWYTLSVYYFGVAPHLPYTFMQQRPSYNFWQDSLLQETELVYAGPIR